MSYRISGLPMARFAPLLALDPVALAARRARRVRATSDRGFPCRVSLRDARAGEELLLLNHVSHEVETPFRAAFAIYVRTQAQEPEPFVDCLPPVFAGRTLSLRGYDGEGTLRDARLAAPDETDGAIRALFAGEEIAYIHAHNAAHGCFAARIDRN